MANETQAPQREMVPTDLCWIVRSPDGKYTLKDEDNAAVMVFTNDTLASAFAIKEVGAGNFKTEQWLWLELALQMHKDGFAGAVIDHAHGNQHKNLALFTAKS